MYIYTMCVGAQSDLMVVSDPEVGDSILADTGLCS